MFLRTIALAGAVALTAGAANADCAFENDTSVKSLSAGFEAWKAVTAAMAECGNVESELDQEFRTKQPAAFAANPSLYHIGGVANATLMPLLNEGSIRALDDLVAEHGGALDAGQLIRINGDVMAIAMMVNAQHLMYRSDILEDLGLEVPTSYNEVLAAAAVIQDAGVVDYPLGATFKTGWNLAEEFVNMHLGMGGSFINDDNTSAVNSAEGVQTLEMLKALTEYMDPEYLVSDSTYVQQQFQQGKIAMANLWASRASAMNNPEESQVVGMVAFAAAPSAIDGGIPATTLWWDGIVIAKNISDEDASAAFRVALEGMDAEMAQANAEAAVWIIPGAPVSTIGAGAFASAAGGAKPYPASNAMGLMHTALGDNISSYLIGESSAEEALAAVDAAYMTSAKEAGLIE